MGVLVRHIKTAAAKTIKPVLISIRFLVCPMIPLSFGVLLLDTSGILYHISRIMTPFTAFLDLPGEAALVFIISIFSNVYAVIGVLTILDFSLRDLTILATLCFIAHNFFIEGSVLKKTGSSLFKLILLRLMCALIAGWTLNLLLPDSWGMRGIGEPTPVALGSVGFNLDQLLPALIPWLISTGILAFKIGIIRFGTLFIQKILEEFKLRQILRKIAAPLMILMGLPPGIGYVWIVENLVGMVYSSDILLEEVRSGVLSDAEADIGNHHIILNHGQLEETLPFIMILGVPYLWTALPGVILACIVVWLERGRRVLFRRAFRVKIESD